MNKPVPALSIRWIAAATIAVVFLCAAPWSHAQTRFGFDCITNSAAASCADGASTLSMAVAPGGAANSVDFTFTNFSSRSSSVTEIYFDDGTLLGLASVSDSGAGVLFSQIGSANPGNLPGGNSITPAFQTTAGFLVDVGSGGNTRGVENRLDGGVQEFVTINFTLLAGRSYADTVAALTGSLGDGTDLRVGLHVRGFSLPYGSSISDSFINTTSPIPEPGTLAMLGALAFCARALRRRESAAWTKSSVCFPRP